jgi:hypothetical protein
MLRGGMSLILLESEYASAAARSYGLRSRVPMYLY